jgi:hypothetical protein
MENCGSCVGVIIPVRWAVLRGDRLNSHSRNLKSESRKSIKGMCVLIAHDRLYIVVDHPEDTPSGLQIQARADDMIAGARPRPTEQLASRPWRRRWQGCRRWRRQGGYEKSLWTS